MKSIFFNLKIKFGGEVWVRWQQGEFQGEFTARVLISPKGGATSGVCAKPRFIYFRPGVAGDESQTRAEIFPCARNTPGDSSGIWGPEKTLRGLSSFPEILIFCSLLLCWLWELFTESSSEMGAGEGIFSPRGTFPPGQRHLSGGFGQRFTPELSPALISSWI